MDLGMNSVLAVLRQLRPRRPLRLHRPLRPPLLRRFLVESFWPADSLCSPSPGFASVYQRSHTTFSSAPPLHFNHALEALPTVPGRSYYSSGFSAMLCRLPHKHSRPLLQLRTRSIALSTRHLDTSARAPLAWLPYCSCPMLLWI